MPPLAEDVECIYISLWTNRPLRESLDAESSEINFARHTRLKTTMARFAIIFTAAIILLSSTGWCNLADGWKTADEEADLNGSADPLERFARRHPPVSGKRIFMKHYTLPQTIPRGGLLF